MVKQNHKNDSHTWELKNNTEVKKDTSHKNIDSSNFIKIILSIAKSIIKQNKDKWQTEKEKESQRVNIPNI